MDNKFKPKKPWFVGFAKPDGSPACVTAWTNTEHEVLVTVRAPGPQSVWTCTASGLPVIDLYNVDPSDESPANWEKALAEAIEATTSGLQVQIDDLQRKACDIRALAKSAETEQIGGKMP